MELNLIDVAIVVIIGFSLLLGLFRGVVKEVLSLSVWIIALLSAVFYFEPVAAYLDFIETPLIRDLVARSGLFFSILVVGAIFNFFISKLFKIADLGGIDRFFGVCFGILRGVFIVTLGVWLCKFSPVVELETWHTSKLIPPVDIIIEATKENIPEAWYEKATKHLE